MQRITEEHRKGMEVQIRFTAQVVWEKDGWSVVRAPDGQEYTVRTEFIHTK